MRAGDAAIEAYELPAAFPLPLDARLCAHIYRAMAALAPMPTRRDIMDAKKKRNDLDAIQRLQLRSKIAEERKNRWEKITADRAAGMTLRALATKYGCSAGRIAQILQKHRVSIERAALPSNDFTLGAALPSDVPLDRIRMSVRLTNVLLNEGLYTVGEVRALRASDLLRVPNFGRVSLAELRTIVGPLADDNRS